MARQTIYRRVADLHAAAIDQGFLSELGPRFLTLLYEAIDRSPSSILIVDVEDSELRGFVSGGTGLGPIYRHLLKRFPALVWALWPVVFSPRKLMRIAELLMHTRRQAPDGLPAAELYSIAVFPGCRGQGVAERLYRALRAAFAERGIAEFMITVGDALAPAQAFYRKMGAEPAARVQVHGDAGSVLFVDRDWA